MLNIAVESVPDRSMVGVILDDHSIMLAVRNGQALVGYDSTGRQRFRSQVTPGGNGGFAFFFNLFRDVHGRAMVWDNVGNRLTSVTATGRPITQVRVDPLPSVRLADGGRLSQSLGMMGALETGEAIATTTFDPNGGAEISHDSVQVFTVARSGRATTIGRVLLAHRFLRRDGQVLQGTVPFGRIGRIGVGRDVWYYTDGNRFSIERRDRTGKLLATFGVARERRPLDSLTLATFRGTAPANADPVLRPAMIKLWAWMPYPDSMPAYGDLHVDRRGIVWAQVHTPSWERGIWDLFTPSGRYLGEVVLPANLRILSVGEFALLGLSSWGAGRDVIQVFRIIRKE